VALASLLVALLALVIALASAAYARRQAAASEGVLSIEQQRRLDERRPRFSGAVERIEQGVVRLVVTLESDEALSKAEFNIVPGQGISFDRNELGVHPVESGGVSRVAFSYGLRPAGEPIGMKPRSSMAWKVKLAENHVDTLRLEVACSDLAGEQWDSILIEAPVEPDITKTVR
jgi:hypothetical protein